MRTTPHLVGCHDGGGHDSGHDGGGHDGGHDVGGHDDGHDVDHDGGGHDDEQIAWLVWLLRERWDQDNASSDQGGGNGRRF